MTKTYADEDKPPLEKDRLNINTTLFSELNKLKLKNTELEGKLLKYQKIENSPSLKEINLELEKRIEDTTIENNEYSLKIAELRLELKDFIQKMKLKDGLISAQENQYYSILKSLKREKEIIKEEEVVDVCKRLISIKETVLKFQETEFPGYLDSLNLINYLKEEVDRFLMLKTVEEIPIDFRRINQKHVIILDTTSDENKIIKAGYLLGEKLLYPAEISVSASYQWFTRDYATHEGKDNLYDQKIRKVISESLAIEETLFHRLEEYLLEIERKHLLKLPSFFKQFFRLSFLDLIEKNPENSMMHLNYRKIISKITEEFRNILEEIPSYDIIRATKSEIKTQEKEIEQLFSKWKTDKSFQINEILEKTKEYVDLSTAEKKVSVEMSRKYPFRIRANSTHIDKLNSYKFLRRARYFLLSLVQEFKKEISITFGTEKDIIQDYYAIFIHRTLPPDLFMRYKAESITEVFPLVIQQLGEVDEIKFKDALKNILLNKGFLNQYNYKSVIKEISRLEFPADLNKRKELIINLLNHTFK